MDLESELGGRWEQPKRPLKSALEQVIEKVS
jgi:hypothetical protein